MSYEPCLVMPIPIANRVVANKLPDVCDSNKPKTDEPPVQSDTVSYDKGDDLSSLDIAIRVTKPCHIQLYL